ncbi:ribonuclease HII [Vulgatibacter sp.]|uniref:ribonuclease HII n=1 Tax=Vulgatibacter sp. TaxID=1971226 RepID=UPI003561F481
MTPRPPSLAELRKRYVDEARPLPQVLEQALRNDVRAGAKALLAAIDKRRHAHRAEGQRLRHMLRYEQAFYADGITLVAGVDEAGMSPLAGPVVAAAVILPVNARIAEVDDSKKLDAPTRERLAAEIKAKAVCWGVGLVEPAEIDSVNIYRAGLLAMRRAVEALAPCPEALLIDARRLKELPIRQEAIIKGDAKSLSIAAASIIAKTTRDARMAAYDTEFPGYGFARHKGYPVKEHYEALEKLGACAIHRRSFAPVRKVLGLDPLQTDLFAPPPDADAAPEDEGSHEA